MLIALDGLKAPISLHNCDEIVPPLTMVLGSWRFRILENSDPTACETGAAISVRRGSKSYQISSPWLDEPVVEQSEVGAVFSLAAELARAFAEERPGLLCLHCAAGKPIVVLSCFLTARMLARAHWRQGSQPGACGCLPMTSLPCPKSPNMGYPSALLRGCAFRCRSRAGLHSIPLSSLTGVLVTTNFYTS